VVIQVAPEQAKFFQLGEQRFERTKPGNIETRKIEKLQRGEMRDWSAAIPATGDKSTEVVAVAEIKRLD
jgi:hypothetical protein